MSTVFTCEHNLGAMLSCIYDAWSSGLGHQNIRLELEPLNQLSLFDTYIHVDEDEGKIDSVISAIHHRISPAFYHTIAYSSGAYEPDILDTIYRVLILGFAYGPSVLDMYQYKDVTRFIEISKRYGSEAHSFREFCRFSRVNDNIFLAHIEPKSHVLLPVAEYFADRMPSELWMIVDDIHREAVIHPINEQYYIRSLSDEEFEIIKDTDKNTDAFTSMWKSYFDSIAIKERANRRCQLNHFPEWKRKHVTEFITP